VRRERSGAQKIKTNGKKNTKNEIPKKRRNEVVTYAGIEPAIS
jgi:hypothetical protein